ncbi:hypothetical protein C8J57DRAFT_1436780 [Mycena rebaudengoi]|nr:hypothetical protein C8J57DRAFT_1436780 [Mycena rebaudengoi]
MSRPEKRRRPSKEGKGKRRHELKAFAVENQETPGFRGMSVVRVRLFFSFSHDGVDYPCALVDWFKNVGRSPDIETGMWIVEPHQKNPPLPNAGQIRLCTVLHLDALLRGAHLLPVYGSQHLPVGFRYVHSLDAFTAYHVNKYVDHHANEIAF